MYRLYTLFFYLALPVLVLRLLIRSRKNPEYRQGLNERFGYAPANTPKNSIWIHACSVGETIAAVPLIKAIKQRYPDIPIIVTNTTATGAERTKALLSNQVTQLRFPYDIPNILQRFLKRTQPRCFITIDTELWPNLFALCAKQNIPVMLANARLSERSAKGYERISFLTHPMLQHVTVLAVQTQTEAQRFINLGLDLTKAKVTGSVKFDLEIAANLLEQGKQLRQLLGQERLTWIAASTHEGEEEIILQAQRFIQQKIPNALLVLVPRHAERFARVIGLCKRENFKSILRSENKFCDTNTQIFIGDSMGELLLFYAACDIAFVGGSFANIGGHNLLEPAAIGLPVITGPQVFNFAQISAELKKAGALMQVNNAEELARQIIELAQNYNKRRQMGQHAQQFLAKNRGAVAKHIALLEKLI